jgi:hypothetical protein
MVGDVLMDCTWCCQSRLEEVLAQSLNMLRQCLHARVRRRKCMCIVSVYVIVYILIYI